MNATPPLPEAAPPAPEVTYAMLQAANHELVARLRDRLAGNTAPQPGQTFPDTMLPDGRGVMQRLHALAAGERLVVSFQRGLWCPYCSAEIAAWVAAVPQLEAAAVRLVLITGQTGGAASDIAARFASPRVTTLCDVDHGFALTLGLAFSVGEKLLGYYHARGLDVAATYGYAAGILPIPATFGLDAAMQVRTAYVEPDFRLRTAPATILDGLLPQPDAT